MNEPVIETAIDPTYGPARNAVVIGYGSPLRSDDAVGLEAAAQVESWGITGLTAIAAHGLTPDLAAVLTRADRAIFIDARVDSLDEGVRCEELTCDESIDRVGHTSHPRQLIGLARVVFGQAPRAWLITIPAFETGIGEALSPSAQQGLKEALQIVACLLSDH